MRQDHDRGGGIHIEKPLPRRPTVTSASSIDTVTLRFILIGCALSVASSVFSTVFILSEINLFYENATADLAEFTILSNSAWHEMISTTPFASTPDESSHPRSARFSDRPRYGAPAVAPYAFVHRFSRQQDAQHAQVPFAGDPFTQTPLAFDERRPACERCSRTQQLCEPGPRGPPGEPGETGFDGLPGQPGTDGFTGLGAMMESLPCIRCPAGPPGNMGQDGYPGPSGPPGIAGYPGLRGKDGQPGSAGPPGDLGTPGIDGPPGERGRNGIPALRYLSERGAPGEPGNRGPEGPPGLMGMPGPVGYPGLVGSQGEPGAPGSPGRDGELGAPGAAGRPGRDAIYCPCPGRHEIIVSGGGVEDPPEDSEEFIGAPTNLMGPEEDGEEESDGEVEEVVHDSANTSKEDQVRVDASTRLVEQYRNRFRNLLHRWRKRKRLLKLRQAAKV